MSMGGKWFCTLANKGSPVSWVQWMTVKSQNEAGQRLIEFCQENTLVIQNTLFQQHKRRFYTWTSPDGQYQNQIDYILCSQRWRSSTQSAKSRPDYKESWVPKKRCFWTVVLEKTLESLLDCNEIQPVYPKGNQSWLFIGRTDAEAETPIFWPPDVKKWLTRKDPDAGKDWSREEKGMIEDEMVWWHHRCEDMSLGKLWELVMDREAWHGVTKSQTWLSDWTELQN